MHAGILYVYIDILHMPAYCMFVLTYCMPAHCMFALTYCMHAGILVGLYTLLDNVFVHASWHAHVAIVSWHGIY